MLREVQGNAPLGIVTESQTNDYSVTQRAHLTTLLQRIQLRQVIFT